jgi:hypothetical protein
MNTEAGARVAIVGPRDQPLQVYAAAFADVGVVTGTTYVAAGMALVARGQIFDEPVKIRVDLPVYLSQPDVAVGASALHIPPRVALRATFSLTDLW